jgi:hypothetical protein
VREGKRSRGRVLWVWQRQQAEATSRGNKQFRLADRGEERKVRAKKGGFAGVADQQQQVKWGTFLGSVKGEVVEGGVGSSIATLYRSVH